MTERRCYVCEEPELVDKHHILPVEYGGPRDGRTVDLCPRCHRLVHRAAERYYKLGEYTPQYERLSNNGTKSRALTLIKYIVRQKGEHETSGKAVADDARNMVAISCTPEELMVFHAVKEQMGMGSLPRAIKALIIREYQKQIGVKDAASRQNGIRKSSPVDNGKPARRGKVRTKKSR